MLAANLWIILLLRLVSAQPSGDFRGTEELDSLLQEYAFRAFVRPRTGAVYQGQPPSNLTGIQLAALRLRSGSLWRRGVSGYNEFRVPVGVAVQPYVERLALVYQNFGNWSSFFFHLPGYTLLAPVLGLIAYDASDLSAQNLPPLEFRASHDPISVSFSGFLTGSHRPALMCAYFALNGSVELSEVVNRDTCMANNQGHFSIVAESSLVLPPPPPPPNPTPSPTPTPRRVSRRVWIIVGSVAAGVVLLILLLLSVSLLIGCIRRKKFRRMEVAAEVGVPLPMAKVGDTKAPVASETRTKPFIETELVP